MNQLDQVSDQRLKDYFRWYWLIEARLFSELCMLKGREVEHDLDRRMQEYSHQAFMCRCRDLCEKLEDPQLRNEAYDVLRERHSSLLSVIELTRRLLGERAWGLIGFAGGTVGEDMGRELRTRLENECLRCLLPEELAEALLPPSAGHSGHPEHERSHRRPEPSIALWEARERGVLGLATPELEHIALRFREGFLRGYRGASEIPARLHPEVDPIVMRHMRCSFPHSASFKRETNLH